MASLRTILPLFIAPLVLLGGCAKQVTPQVTVGLSAPKTPGEGKGGVRAPFPLLAATAIARLPEGASGPYLAAHGDHALAVFAAPGRGAQGVKGEVMWQAVATFADGSPRGTARVLAPAPVGLQLASLRPAADGSFVLVWVRRGESGYLIEGLLIDQNGAAKGKVATLYQGAEPVLWTEGVAAEGGAHVYFAVSSPNGKHARLLVVSLGADSVPRATAQIVSDSTLAWQAVSAGASSLLLAVKGAGNAAQGQVVAVPVDASGRPQRAQIVESRASAEIDLEASSIGDKVAVAWTDRSGIESEVRVAIVDGQGRTVVAPTSPVRSAGEQALVSLTASTGPSPRLLVVWDDLARKTHAGRTVRMTSLEPDLKGGGEAGTFSMGVREETTPLLSGTNEGFGVMALARACQTSAASCDEAPIWPTYVKLGRDLSVQATGPLVAEPLAGEPPDMAWGLACTDSSCLALLSDRADPPSAYLAKLEPKERAFYPVVERDGAPTPPTVTRIDPLWKGPHLADLAAARVDGVTLVASVTEHHEGEAPPPLPADADARAEGDKDRTHQRSAKAMPARGAIVSVHVLDEKGALTATRSLSVRALTEGGVAIAADAEGKSAAVAWVARDQGEPQLFLTTVGPDGKRKSQQMLTRAKGEVTDVAIAAVSDGWIVSWVDTRDGNGEVYAARVDRSLHKKGNEQRITNAPGDATDVELLVTEREALVAYSDPRSARTGGIGDVFVSRLRLTDAARQGDETRVASTSDHARALRFSRAGQDTLLAWLETPPPAQMGARPARVQMVTLDEAGAPRALPDAITVSGQGPLSSLAMTCGGDDCRFVVARPEGEGVSVAAFRWQKGQREVQPRVLAPLFGRPAADVVPVITGDFVLMSDEGASSDGVLRRAIMKW